MVNTVSMSSLGSNCASGGANKEPFCGAADATPRGAAASDEQGIIAFAGERSGFLAFVVEVGLGSSELCLAGFAVDREVVERL